MDAKTPLEVEHRAPRLDRRRRAAAAAAPLSRRSPICASARAGACRASPSISSMAAAARTRCATATAWRSTRSGSWRAMASARGAVSTEVELFGRRYAAPIGIAPMGMGGLLWPRAEIHLATAAQAMKVPYVLATPASASIEEIARIAPDVFWFQLYGSPGNDNRITFDLVRRAEAAGAHALVVTIDTPVRAKRPQDWRNGLAVPFKPNLRTIVDIATSPLWALEVLRNGVPCSANFIAYAGQAVATAGEVAGLRPARAARRLRMGDDRARAQAVAARARRQGHHPSRRRDARAWRSAPTASSSRTMAAARSTRRRPRSTCCRRWSERVGGRAHRADGQRHPHRARRGARAGARRQGGADRPAVPVRRRGAGRPAAARTCWSSSPTRSAWRWARSAPATSPPSPRRRCCTPAPTSCRSRAPTREGIKCSIRGRSVHDSRIMVSNRAWERARERG